MIFEGRRVHFRSQNGSKIAFQTAARPQDGPRQLQDAPGRFQEAQRRPQDAPRRPQSGPKTAPRRPQDAPRRPQGMENLEFKNGFLADPLHRRSQDAPRFPRRPQDGHKTRPRRPKTPPKEQARWRGRDIAALKIIIIKFRK